MKTFNRLPPKLKRLVKVAMPTAIISVCLGMNTTAFTEIRQSVASRRSTLELTNSPVTIQSTAAVLPDNQLVATPTASPQRTSEAIQLRPISTDDFVNDLPPIKITPVITGSATCTSNRPALGQDQAGQDRSEQGQVAQYQAEEIALQPAEKYGHRAYTEGNEDDMVLVASYVEGSEHRAETLHPETARALLEMTAAARLDGIWLVPASGFRTITEQRAIFNAQIERQGSPEAAAKVSAPPGYSEHHTGFAVDLADGSLPQTQDINDSFADTAAYQWLLANAANYGFELSFPENNDQGLSFEPWHWRYVGSVQSRESLGLQLPTLDTRNATSRPLE